MTEIVTPTSNLRFVRRNDKYKLQQRVDTSKFVNGAGWVVTSKWIDVPVTEEVEYNGR